jgi:protein-S-isoprenylcysteine O-methyltransferase Ste14
MQKIDQLVGHYRTFLSFILSLLFLWFAKPTFNSILWGLPIVILGEVIRIWASGYLNKDTREYVTVFGPYGYTRNPLYVGNFFLGLGFVAMSHHWVVIIIFLILFFLIYRSTILDEEKLLTNMFGSAYTAYRKKVPRFFPRWPSSFPSQDKNVIFLWKQVFRREYRAWMGIIVVLFLLIVRAKTLFPND